MEQPDRHPVTLSQCAWVLTLQLEIRFTNPGFMVPNSIPGHANVWLVKRKTAV